MAECHVQSFLNSTLSKKDVPLPAESLMLCKHHKANVLLLYFRASLHTLCGHSAETEQHCDWTKTQAQVEHG